MDRAEALLRARAAGVTEVLVPAIGPDGWAGLEALARTTPQVRFGLGIHPQELPELDPEGDLRRLSDLDRALSRGAAVAVGECGLDGPSALPGAGPFPAPLSRQQEVLRGQLGLARKHRLPAMLHCLRAHEPLLVLLAEEPLSRGGVLHSYSGGAELVKPYSRLGLYFSFAGPLTYERARKPQQAARAVARDRLLIETDAPDQTPRPKKGRNEPSYLPGIASALGVALGLSLCEVDDLTTRNARALFGPRGV